MNPIIYPVIMQGRLNAFEEYAVRVLTTDVMNNKFPNDLISYLKELV